MSGHRRMPELPVRSRSRGRLLLRAVALVLVAASAGTAGHAPAEATEPRGPFVVTESTAAGRLRVFGRPGDLGLGNRAVTAIVRKRDGALVDFWPNTPAVPTAPQLRKMTKIDGLWLFVPVVHDGRQPHDLVARSVRIAGDAVETIAELSLGAGTIEVTTSYRLSGDSPRLIITSTFRHESGGRLAQLRLADRVKWGNVDYFLDGRGRGPQSFSGPARWVGRKGASGDLKLETLEKEPMRVTYRARHWGLQPEIWATYAATTLAPHESITVQRALAYEPIAPVHAPGVPRGTVEVVVTDEKQRPLAAKLSFRGLFGTPDPNFGNDGDERGARRFVWSGNGKFRRDVRAGRYRLMVTAGIERAAATWNVDLAAGETAELKGTVPRVIETPGRIAADLHLHQVASVDADIACSTRIISVAAEGIEFAAATDHYVVSDYAPAARALLDSGLLASPLVTVTGTEVSTVGNRFGHFNLMPMPLGSNVDYTNTTPHRLFQEMRRASPHGILQVNHPRWSEIGYFHRFEMDPGTGRIPAVHRSEFDGDFDALEIFNGLDSTSEPKVRTVLYDWIHLLGRGHRYVATGNSDSHKLAFHDPGLPRNLIRYGEAASDAEDTRVSPRLVLDAVRQGHVVVTSGPVLDVDVLGIRPGGTVRGKGRHLPLHVLVRAAPWIDVREVEVLLGKDGRRIRWIPVKESTKITRLDTTVDVVVQAPTFVIVLAKGAKGLPNVFLPKVKPMAITNPIWLEP